MVKYMNHFNQVHFGKWQIVLFTVHIPAHATRRLLLRAGFRYRWPDCWVRPAEYPLPLSVLEALKATGAAFWASEELSAREWKEFFQKVGWDGPVARRLADPYPADQPKYFVVADSIDELVDDLRRIHRELYPS